MYCCCRIVLAAGTTVCPAWSPALYCLARASRTASRSTSRQVSSDRASEVREGQGQAQCSGVGALPSILIPQTSNL